MLVVVTGGRNYANMQMITDVLDFVHRAEPITGLINGLANGADSLCRKWAVNNNVTPMDFPAKWEDIHVMGAVIRNRRDGTKYNVVAGFQRNQAMVDAGAQMVVAFPGGNGTADMMARCEKAKLLLLQIP
jgi:predicted Rossmann-fold nucleotide-binding protein